MDNFQPDVYLISPLNSISAKAAATLNAITNNPEHMKTFDRKRHWEKIYRTKPLHEVSRYEPTPETSLDFFKQFNVPPDAKIIDIGGGDSLLVDHLLERGYRDISVLDISVAAIKRRVGKSARLQFCNLA